MKHFWNFIFIVSLAATIAAYLPVKAETATAISVTASTSLDANREKSSAAKEETLQTNTRAKNDIRIIKMATTSATSTRGNFASTTKRAIESAKDKINAIRAEEQKKVNQKIDSLKAARLAERNAKIIAYSKRTVNRLDAAVLRLQTLSDRINSRLGKLTAQGVDESRAKEKLQTAQNKIFDAQKAVDSLLVFVETFQKIDAQDEAALRAATKDFKQKVAEAIFILNEAHSALANAISSIKPGLNAKATTTIEARIQTGTTTEN